MKQVTRKKREEEEKAAKREIAREERRKECVRGEDRGARVLSRYGSSGSGSGCSSSSITSSNVVEAILVVVARSLPLPD